MDAKEYLSQIKLQELKIKNCQQEIERFQDIAGGLTGSHCDGVKVRGGNVNTKERNLAIYVDKKDVLMEEINTAIRKRSRIISLLEKLNVKDYDILYRIYVYGQSLKEIEIDTGKSHSGITYAHKRALNNFQALILSMEDAYE